MVCSKGVLPDWRADRSVSSPEDHTRFDAFSERIRVLASNPAIQPSLDAQFSHGADGPCAVYHWRSGGARAASPALLGKRKLIGG